MICSENIVNIALFYIHFEHNLKSKRIKIKQFKGHVTF